MTPSYHKIWVSTIMSFMDELIGNSIYTIYELPTIKKWNSPHKGGYRPHTKHTGDERSKSINWIFRTIQPSREEIESRVGRFSTTHDLDKTELNKDQLQSTLLEYMDEFVNEYCLFTNTEMKITDRLFNGYRPSSDKEDGKVSMYFKTLQPNRVEIESFISMWVNSKY